MSKPSLVRLPQDRDTSLSVVVKSRYIYRYAYVRSADSDAAGDPGQDYLAICDDGARLAFALCDGVGQSFFGDLAARLVGDQLIRLLWNEINPTSDRPTVEELLTSGLQRLTDHASELVHVVELSADLPPMLVNVLEQKRELGSESTFAAGLIDYDANRLTLVWMGDSRIRLWGPRGERTADLGDAFHTMERWSSRRGPVGRVHVFTNAVNEIYRLVVYSDGLSILNSALDQLPTSRDLDALIGATRAAPTSDDASFLEIAISATPDYLDTVLRTEWGAAPAHLEPPEEIVVVAKGDQLRASWPPVVGASHYDVEVGSQALLRQVPQPGWELSKNELMVTPPTVRVRACADDTSGDWSQPVAIPHPPQSPRWHLVTILLVVWILGFLIGFALRPMYSDSDTVPRPENVMTPTPEVGLPTSAPTGSE
jgi:hypothetical protein